MSDLVSIVMPAYNASKTIDAAISSVLEQTYQNFELVIVDDASTDNTSAVIRKYTDSRIKFMLQSENKGEGATRDAAIAQCVGEWIAVLDADDAWATDRLERLISLEPTISHEHIIVDNIMRCYSKQGQLTQWKPLWKSGDSFLAGNPKNLRDYLSLHSHLIKPLFPRRAVIETGVTHSDLKFGADTEYFIKLMKLAGLQILVLPEPLYLYRLAPGSMTSNPDRAVLKKKMFLGLLSDVEMDPEERLKIDQHLVVLDKSIEYLPFLKALKGKHYLTAFILALKRPHHFLEFVKRSPNTLFNRIYLFLKRGEAR